MRDPDHPLGAGAAIFEGYLRRRLAREPVWRILGRREFWGLDLEITPDVLDPRPDTETLIGAALGIVGPNASKPWRILDLGTGSGAILCALLSELPAARGWAVDASAEACAVARRNLERHGLGGRSLVLQGDWAGSLGPHSFDLVLSNPPYIETAVIAGLDPEVRGARSRPVRSTADPTGSRPIGRSARKPRAFSRRRGHVLLEVGAGQAGAVADCCCARPASRIDRHGRATLRGSSAS